MDYYKKYLKYKYKYINLKKQYGGGFYEIYNELTNGLTDFHLEELKVENTLDGIKKGIRLIKENKVKTGIVNKNQQPRWYTENPQFSIIASNPKYLNDFNIEINKYELIDDNISIGGTMGGPGGLRIPVRKKGDQKPSNYAQIVR